MQSYSNNFPPNNFQRKKHVGEVGDSRERVQSQAEWKLQGGKDERNQEREEGGQGLHHGRGRRALRLP